MKVNEFFIKSKFQKKIISDMGPSDPLCITYKLRISSPTEINYTPQAMYRE